MQSFDRERLLRDVLEDESYGKFRAQTFAALRRELRRRKPFDSRPWLAIAAAAALLAIFWPDTPIMDRARPAESTAVASPAGDHPEAGVFYVKTQPVNAFDVVRSVPDKSLIVETSRVPGANVQIVHTRPFPVPEVSDAQLLALFANRPAGFIDTRDGKDFVTFEDRN